ncbi:uncharacterized protein LOC135847544 [Planococcus citri]|uniref:uncharacterized protein LOC135847544 n=1 Tax=Planococcus citri TaxID=170843 RepID=UPI0031F93B37
MYPLNSACPLSTEIIKKATISGFGLLVQKVYDDAENPTKVETDICDEPITPSIVFDPVSGNFEMGYEMFYREGQLIKLKCDFYNDLLNIIDGKPNQEDRQPINDESITTIDEDGNTTFQMKANPDKTMIEDGEPNQEDGQLINDESTTTIDEDANTTFQIKGNPDKTMIIDGEPNKEDGQLINDESTNTTDEDANTTFQIKDKPDETMVFYWIPVLTLEYFTDSNRRHITIKKDVINDYFHKERVISHCENYYLSIGDQIVPLEREQDEFKQPADDNPLEKTQIVPMHMLHTVPGRLATCLYANIAFIWSSIANGQLQEVDLFLYTLYKLHPANINIYFGVNYELEDTSPELTASENPIFNKYPIPGFVYRIVEWTNNNYDNLSVYKVIVVIHNDTRSIKEGDRICSNSEQVPGWNDIKSSDTTTLTGTSYTCPYSGKNTLEKMGLHRNYSWQSFSVENFPIIDESTGHISLSDISKQVRAEFNRLKNLNNYV